MCNTASTSTRGAAVAHLLKQSRKSFQYPLSLIVRVPATILNNSSQPYGVAALGALHQRQRRQLRRRFAINPRITTLPPHDTFVTLNANEIAYMRSLSKLNGAARACALFQKNYVRRREPPLHAFLPTRTIMY